MFVISLLVVFWGWWVVMKQSKNDEVIIISEYDVESHIILVFKVLWFFCSPTSTSCFLFIEAVTFFCWGVKENHVFEKKCEKNLNFKFYSNDAEIGIKLWVEMEWKRFVCANILSFYETRCWRPLEQSTLGCFRLSRVFCSLHVMPSHEWWL